MHEPTDHQRYIEGYRNGMADAVHRLAVPHQGVATVGGKTLAQVLHAIRTKPIGALVREGW